ncbi:hypothetical protein ACFGVR_00635 [Mucilaginibacter sp. AW1-3]
MNGAITNISELRAEIERLRQKKSFQEAELKEHFNSPVNIFNTVRSLFSRHHGDQHDLFKPGTDVFSWLSKILLPLTLNKTLFRKSNFIIKSLVALVSQKVAPQINQKSVTGVWDKLKGAIPNLLHRSKSKQTVIKKY